MEAYLQRVYPGFKDNINHTVERLQWFYWSAPFEPESLRVYKWDKKMARHLKYGDAMYIGMGQIGFHRVLKHSPVRVVFNNNRKYVEVIRRSVHNPEVIAGVRENDKSGYFYFSAPGSGIWLDIGDAWDRNRTFPEKTNVMLSRRWARGTQTWNKSAPLEIVETRKHEVTYNGNKRVTCLKSHETTNTTWLRYGYNAELPCLCSDSSDYLNCGYHHYHHLHKHPLASCGYVQYSCNNKLFRLKCTTNCVNRFYETKCATFDVYLRWPPPIC